MALPEVNVHRRVTSSWTPGRESLTVHSSPSDNGLACTATPQLESMSPHAQVSQNRNQASLDTQADGKTSDAPMGPTCTCMAEVDIRDILPVDSDEILLSVYKNQLCRQFPFVIIPASTTPIQLQATRPFLMKVIRMVASVRHLRLMRGQGRAIMVDISNAMLLRSERSMDLLQGILVLLGSYHYHCMAHAQFNNLIRLATSLVEDMNLSSCPKSQQMMRQIPLVRARESLLRTNEEKRALLGVWYMSSRYALRCLHAASRAKKLNLSQRWPCCTTVCSRKIYPVSRSMPQRY
jgi:hypothetical protein